MCRSLLCPPTFCSQHTLAGKQLELNLYVVNRGERAAISHTNAWTIQGDRLTAAFFAFLFVSVSHRHLCLEQQWGHRVWPRPLALCPPQPLLEPLQPCLCPYQVLSTPASQALLVHCLYVSMEACSLILCPGDPGWPQETQKGLGAVRAPLRSLCSQCFYGHLLSAHQAPGCTSRSLLPCPAPGQMEHSEACRRTQLWFGLLMAPPHGHKAQSPSPGGMRGQQDTFPAASDPVTLRFLQSTEAVLTPRACPC
jgi:hypothetical protein